MTTSSNFSALNMDVKLLKIKLIIIFLFTTPLYSIGQNFVVSGVVSYKDQQNVRVSGTTVTLTQVDEDKRIYLSSVDSNGVYLFENIVKGMYEIRVLSSAQIYEDQKMPLHITKDFTSLNFELERQSIEIEEINVVAKKRLIEAVGDKITIDASQLTGYQTDNGLEILGNAPGIWLDGESIRINGSDETLILINGRQQSISKAQTIALLKTMRANQIDKIELLTGGSSKYDASGGSVINIVTKRNGIDGLKLGITSEGILNDGIGASQNLTANFQSKKFQMQLGYGYQNAFQNSTEIGRSDYLDRGTWTAYNREDSIRLKSHSMSASLFYEISKQQDINLSLTTSLSKKVSVAQQEDVYSGNEVFSLDFNNSVHTKDNLLSAYVDYGLKLDTNLKRTLNFNYGILRGGIKSKMDIINNYGFENGVIDLNRTTADIPLSGMQHKFAADYFQELGSLSIESGLKYSTGHIDNYASYYRLVDANYFFDHQLSDSLRYSEKVLAGYFSNMYKGRKFNFKGGVRLEYTRIRSQNIADGAKFENSYTNVLPFFSVNYLNENFPLTLKLTSGLTRPEYSYLNPFTLYINEFRYRVGNGSLKPQSRYTLAVESSPFDFLFFSIGYNRINDMVFLVNKQTEVPLVIEQRPENALALDDYFANISFYYKVLNGKLFGQLNMYGEIFKYNIKDEFVTSFADLETNKFGYLSWSNNLKVLKNLMLSTTVNYRSKANFYQIMQAKRWRFDLSMSYKIGKYFTVFSKVDDLFRSYNMNNVSYYNNFNNVYFKDIKQFRVRFGVTYSLDKGIISSRNKDRVQEDLERYN